MDISPLEERVQPIDVHAKLLSMPYGRDDELTAKCALSAAGAKQTQVGREDLVSCTRHHGVEIAATTCNRALVLVLGAVSF